MQRKMAIRFRLKFNTRCMISRHPSQIWPVECILIYIECVCANGKCTTTLDVEKIADACLPLIECTTKHRAMNKTNNKQSPSIQSMWLRPIYGKKRLF